MAQVVLVTGGSRGIGLGIVKRLAEIGCDVAVTASSEQISPELEAILDKGPKGKIVYYKHDMRDLDAIEPLLDKIELELGPLSTLVSNAGVTSPVRGDLLDVTPINLQKVLDVNLVGGFFLAQACAKRLTHESEALYKSIIFVTSVSAQTVSTNRAEYCISKAGASMMAKLFATRLAENNIGVFEIRPGVIPTKMNENHIDGFKKRIEDGLVPMQRLGRTQDVAQVILPLVRGEMAFATGAAIPVDGGLSINRL